MIPKFRAWLKKEKRIIDVGSLSMDMEKIQFLDFDAPGIPTEWVDFKDLELLQWTGLCDQNGTEIYEGDIIRTDENELGLVKFEDGVFDVNRLIMLKNRRDWTQLAYVDWPSDFFDDCEVLGNKFENPELLEGE